MWGGAFPKERGYEPSDRDGKGSSGMGRAEGKSPAAWGVGKVSPKEREGGGKKAAGAGSRREVVVGEDGLPDWSVLMRRVGGLAQETGSFTASCFVENDETDTQVLSLLMLDVRCKYVYVECKMRPVGPHSCVFVLLL